MSNAVPPFIVAIPARYGSTRLPAKPLREIGGVPMVVRAAQRALQAGASQVVVAVDDQRIALEVVLVQERHGVIQGKEAIEGQRVAIAAGADGKIAA